MHPNPSAYAGTTPRAIRTAKPSRYARVYFGTSPNPVISYEAEGLAFRRMEPAGVERHRRAGRKTE